MANPKANPETLFAAGYAACFQGALTARAAQQDVDASDSSITATVSFGSASDGGFGLAVALEASIPGVDKARTQELMELAHEVCPYSKATRGQHRRHPHRRLIRAAGIPPRRRCRRRRYKPGTLLRLPPGDDVPRPVRGMMA